GQGTQHAAPDDDGFTVPGVIGFLDQVRNLRLGRRPELPEELHGCGPDFVFKASDFHDSPGREDVRRDGSFVAGPGVAITPSPDYFPVIGSGPPNAPGM